MPGAPIPANESARLDALMRAAIMDTGAEQFFEDMVESVQEVVQAPIVLVSLIDEWRQWFKAKRGLDIAETKRDEAFCAYAILGDEPLLIADARLDARFNDNPHVCGDPPVVAYAGAPIVLQCGARLGTVCAIDNKPRNWREREVAQLTRCARMVARHIDARRAHLERDRQRFLEMALVRAESRYESVIESMSEGMVVQGPSGAIIDSNPAAWEILGLSRDELFGRASKDPRWRAIKACGEEFPGEEHPAMVTLRTGEPQHRVIMGVETPNGERRWLSINSYPIRRPSDGRIEQVVAVFRLTGPPPAAAPLEA
jgi:PAS domain S-box-containing protein